jgi:hypothetical protein
MNEQEKQFKDGFNSGYLLAKHDPELCKAVLDAAGAAKSKSEYAYGLSAGHDVYHVEMMIDQNRKEIGLQPEKKVISETNKNLASDYKRGFNNGYILSKYEPELTKKLLKISLENPSQYYKGLVSGKQEHEMEKMRTRLKTITPNKTPSKGKNIDKGRGK